MGNELAALAAVQRGGDADLAAELIGLVGLALTDAFGFRSVQGIDLPAALASILGVDLAGERERQSEGGFQLRLAPDAPTDVPDDPAQHRADRSERPVGPVELLGVGIALMGDQGMLADAPATRPA